MNNQATNDSIPTRPTLLLRLKDWGDQASWNAFCENYSQLIYKFALKAEMTHSEAEEVVQETLISVAKNIGEFRYDPTVCSFKTWLLQATRWRIQGQLRHRRRARSFIDPIADSPDSSNRLERVADPALSNLDQLWREEWENNLLEVALERVKRLVSARHYQIFDLYAIKE